MNEIRQYIERMKTFLSDHSLILMEAAIVERLRRDDRVSLHPTLVNAPLIYDEAGRTTLRAIYQEYIDIALSTALPFIMCAPTWRANRARVAAAAAPSTINADAVLFIQELRGDNPSIKIGGMIGCKNDCYKPQEGLSVEEAESFHSWQIHQLAETGVDFLLAETLPSVEEAVGIAKAMSATGVPYMISFVISRDGSVLDGAPLRDAIQRVDSETNHSSLGFMVNCAYPTFLCADTQPPELFDRLVGYQANASSLDQCDLDGADQLKAESAAEWGAEMLRLNRQFGIKILGGCCGTASDHLRYLVRD